MTELEAALIGDSAGAPPAHIIEGLDAASAHCRIDDVPHTVYQELWHAAFWQRLTLDWIEGSETRFPVHNAQAFPAAPEIEAENWLSLCARFLAGAEQSAAVSRALDRLDHRVQCTSRPGLPMREKSIRDLLEGTAAHNQYHLGRIVLLRQLLHQWPPPSGGDTW